MARVLITGGLGLVGVNYAAHCMERGDSVYVLDNEARGLSSVENAKWLRDRGEVDIVIDSIVDRDAIVTAFRRWRGFDRVVHLAAQSSVNKSMESPELDFNSNVVGTFNVLEETRLKSPEAVFVFFASNKIYDVTQWATRRTAKRYVWETCRVGPSEAFPFYTDAREPYGASKISGMYYTRCYAAMYDLPAVVMVPSGMYGPRQFGRASQGWLGWFVNATLLGLPITIAGDGLQVRDMLHVDDVNAALDLVSETAPSFRGSLFNLGGGPRNAPSLVEALLQIESHLGVKPNLVYSGWRPQDNKVYISNCERLIGQGWHPKVSIEEGIERQCTWALQNKNILKQIYAEDIRNATRHQGSTASAR